MKNPLGIPRSFSVVGHCELAAAGGPTQAAVAPHEWSRVWYFAAFLIEPGTGSRSRIEKKVRFGSLSPTNFAARASIL